MKTIMKFSYMIACIVLILSCGKEAETSCTDGILNGTETGIDCGGDCASCYGVGLLGEAGGMIFYDKGAATDGWQYLEAANSDFDDNGCFGSIQYDSQSDTDNNIGTGLENTMNVAAVNSVATIYSLAISHSEGGKSDWFIPSKDELSLIFENRLMITNLSNASGECKLYWGSTLEELSNGNWLSKTMDVTSGEFFFPNPAQRVRLIRRF